MPVRSINYSQDVDSVSLLNIGFLIPIFVIAEAFDVQIWGNYNKLIIPIFILLFLHKIYKKKPLVWGKEHLFFGIFLIVITCIDLFNPSFEGFKQRLPWEFAKSFLFILSAYMLRINGRELAYALLISYGMTIAYFFISGFTFSGGLVSAQALEGGITVIVGIGVLRLLLFRHYKVGIPALIFLLVVPSTGLKVGMLVAGTVFMLYRYRVSSRSIMLFISLVIFSVIAFAVWAAFFPYYYVGDISSYQDINEFTGGRANYWHIYVTEVIRAADDDLSRLLFPHYPGYGDGLLSNVTRLCPEYRADQCSHSLYLEMIADYGIIGLILFFFPFMFLFKEWSIIYFAYWAFTAGWYCQQLSPQYFLPLTILLSEYYASSQSDPVVKMKRNCRRYTGSHPVKRAAQ